MRQNSGGWRDISDDPGNSSVHEFLRKRMREIRRATVTEPIDFLADFVSAQSVLDVGVVEHTISRTYGDNWKHDRIRAKASRLVGVDIVPEAVTSLCERGYDVRLVDATSESYLGERFSRVVIGDVIEHVDSPVALLKFAARHLEDKGVVLCTTPNPFFAGHLVRGFLSPPFVANGEHISWITPTMALEIGRRAGLELVAYHHAQGTGSNFVRRQLVRVLALLGQLDKEIFAGDYYYIFEKEI